MVFTYRHAGRIPVLPALAAAGAIVVVGGIAATIVAIAGGVWYGTRLLRALGLVGTTRGLRAHSDDIIEGVVVNRSDAGSKNQRISAGVPPASD